VALRIYSRPSTSGRVVQEFGVLADQQWLTLVCATRGEPVANPISGLSTDVWAKVEGGYLPLAKVTVVFPPQDC
jgi:hypothetical protein